MRNGQTAGSAPKLIRDKLLRCISHREQLLQRHIQIPQVPEDPEEQAEEKEQRPREDEEIPEAEGSKDPDEEEDEACDIQEYGEEEEHQAAAEIGGVLHVSSERSLDASSVLPV
ncbi:hypothetical protein JOB18_011346 [Solea senegalensis]|uniref:Uncharacterized protein n=1 Tax=Solea senegalensis TaxID=28829 RepID=A0AAV6RMC6_SOLSE|nr:hypothetical protein JOB18_011346 [Solea senegalensis]